MATFYRRYTPQQIQSILEEYEPRVRGKGIRALAKKHKVQGGHNLIKYWLSKWDGTVESLETVSGGDRRSILTNREKNKYVDRYITRRSKKDAVQYPEVKVHIENKTGKNISLPTVQRIGHELGHTSKKVKRVLESEGISSLCVFSYDLLRDKRFQRKRGGVSKKVSKDRQKSLGLHRRNWNALRTSKT